MALMRPPRARVRRGLDRERFTVPSNVVSYSDLESLEGPKPPGKPRVVELPLGRRLGAYVWLRSFFPPRRPKRSGQGHVPDAAAADLEL
jgi:hypothetical protein